ncbi:MAG: glycerol kinase GlpK [Arenicella sp.]
MAKKYLISLDQGTSSSRAILFDSQARIVRIAQREFTQHFPEPGWVEHDPEEIWQSQLGVLEDVIKECSLSATDITAIGITNQRETTIVWDKQTGKPIYNAIVWQDKRTTAICEAMIADDWQTIVERKTGLVLDAYFSATKIQWILDNVDGARERAEQGDLLFGTVDSWLLWKLTDAEVHATDCSNASRTLLFNIETAEWDLELLEAFNIPEQMLPEVRDSAGHFGAYTIDNKKIPITGIVGDQQAALFGQLCLQAGDVKNTYGTGCFMLMNTGKERIESESGLLTTVAWRLQGEIVYALEGSVFVAGAAIQWLRDGLQLIDDAGETERLALEAANDEVVVVPAFVGLGAPHWDMYARGAIFGLTRDSGKAELVRATLQSLAMQSYDVLTAMNSDSGIELNSLKVDGGAIANDYLAQFQADILSLAVERPKVIESTAVGAAYMAGIGVGLWTLDELQQQREVDRVFSPEMLPERREHLLRRWHKAVERSRGWLEDDS